MSELAGAIFADAPDLLEMLFSDATLISCLKAHGAVIPEDEPIMSTLLKVVTTTRGSDATSSNVGDGPRRGLYEVVVAPEGETAPGTTPGRPERRWLDWDLLPTEEHHEPVLRDIFKNVIQYICEALNIKSERTFSSKFANKAAADTKGRALRKPDVVVLNAVEEKDSDWTSFFGTIEDKTTHRTLAEARRQVRQYSRMIFKNQPGRRFVVSAAITVQEMLVILHDRSGEMSSKSFNVNEEPEKLLRFLVAFAFCDKKYLGYDPSYVKEGEDTFITVCGKKYQVVDEIFNDSSIRGRGTLVRLLKDADSGRLFVLKDVWVDRSRKQKEWDMLNKVKKARKGVVKMESHEEVWIDGQLDTTETMRMMMTQEARNKEGEMVERWKTSTDWKDFEFLEIRDHYRILFKTYGKPLESFRSKKELVSAFRDIFRTIGELYDDKILHRDISLRNLVLVDVDDCEEDDNEDEAANATPAEEKSDVPVEDKSTAGPKLPSPAPVIESKSADGRRKTPLRRGVIIDFDYAIDRNMERGEHARGRATGTLPFMAIDILRMGGLASSESPERLVDDDGEVIWHDVFHDAESAFYVLCWLCTAQSGPNYQARKSFNSQKAEIGKWAAAGVDNPQMDAVASAKYTSVNTDADFNRRIVKQFDPYFEELVRLIKDLRELVCPMAALTKTQKQRIQEGLLPDWVDLPKMQRSKDKVFAKIDEIFEEILDGPEIDEGEPDLSPIAMPSTAEPKLTDSPLRRLARRGRRDPAEDFDEDHLDEDEGIAMEDHVSGGYETPSRRGSTSRSRSRSRSSRSLVYSRLPLSALAKRSFTDSGIGLDGTSKRERSERLKKSRK